MVHDMMINVLYCMEDSSLDDLFWNYLVENFALFPSLLLPETMLIQIYIAIWRGITRP